MDAQFATQAWGSGTLDTRQLLADDSVVLGLTLGTAGDAGKTALGDSWPVAAAASLAWDGGYLPGDPDEPHAQSHANVSIAEWQGIQLPVLYAAGSGEITLKLFMNTGMTGPSGYPVSSWQNDTAWGGQAVTLAVGQTAVLNLDFDLAQAWNAADNPSPHSGAGEAWLDGAWHAVNERDRREITNLGFEVYGPAGAGITLRLNFIPEPLTAHVLAAAAAMLLTRRGRRPELRTSQSPQQG